MVVVLVQSSASTERRGSAFGSSSLAHSVLVTDRILYLPCITPVYVVHCIQPKLTRTISLSVLGVCLLFCLPPRRIVCGGIIFEVLATLLGMIRRDGLNQYTAQLLRSPPLALDVLIFIFARNWLDTCRSRTVVKMEILYFLRSSSNVDCQCRPMWRQTNQMKGLTLGCLTLWSAS